MELGLGLTANGMPRTTSTSAQKVNLSSSSDAIIQTQTVVHLAEVSRNTKL